MLTKVTNARPEATNAKIRWTKRLGCGYRNRERFRNAICFHLGGLDFCPDAVATHTKSSNGKLLRVQIFESGRIRRLPW